MVITYESKKENAYISVQAGAETKSHPLRRRAARHLPI